MVMKCRIPMNKDFKSVFIDNSVDRIRTEIDTTVQVIAHYLITMILCNGKSVDFCRQFLDNLKTVIPKNKKQAEKLLRYCNNMLGIDVENIIEVSTVKCKRFKKPTNISRKDLNKFCEIWYNEVYKIQKKVAIEVTAAIFYTLSNNLNYTPEDCKNAYRDMDSFCRMMSGGTFFGKKHNVNEYIDIIENDYGIELYDEIKLCLAKYTLPIKAKWYDMIESGKKKEEYRADTPYYDSRFKKYEGQHILVAFRNGYSRKSRTIVKEVIPIKRKGGKPEWGGDWETNYWVLKIIN
jgi:hypothetical protein